MITPDGMPVLTLRRPGESEAAVVATLGDEDVDWYRWSRGAFIAPVSDPHVARGEITRALRPAETAP